MAGTVHRFKTEGEGRIKSFKCSCGGWAMTGSEKRVKGIKALWSQHAEKGGLSSAREQAQEEGDTGDE